MLYKTNYKKLCSLSAILLLVFFLSADFYAAPGDLDPTFGGGGKVITYISGKDFGSSVVLQSNGKLIVAGEATVNTSTTDFAIVRYNLDGSLDTSFGNGGRVITDFGRADWASAVARQSDGKIVVAGVTVNLPDPTYSTSNFALARYNTNGSLDSTFGTGGKVTTDFFGFQDYLAAIIIQPDGKIVAAGMVTPVLFNHNFGLVRYNSDGSLDTTFGSGGKVSTDFNGQIDAVNALVLQADGKLVAAGCAGVAGSLDFALARYNSDGSLDSTFGSGGKVSTDLNGQYDQANALVLQTDGRLVAAGYIVDYKDETPEFSLARYNSNGTLDSTFGNGGKVITDFGLSGYIAEVALQADGKIVAAGTVYINGADDFGLVRYNTNGTLDTTFGTGGKVTTTFGGGDGAGGIVIQPDGKIVAVGSTANANFSAGNFALARYLGDSAVARRAPFDFDGDGKADVSVFRPSDGVWYLLRSGSGFTAAQFGVSTDKITPADYDGDGKTDIAVFRDGTWYWLNSSNGNFNAVQFGLADDIPVPADYTGDGRTELAVYRAGSWFTLNLVNNQFQAVQFGNSTDKPVASDYDGDSRADYAVYRDGIWYLLQSTQGFAAIQFGLSTDKVVPADYDGDGKTDQAVYRDGIWYLLRSQAGFTAFQFGIASDVPAPADYDGDGRADAAVYRDGVWYLLRSQQGFGAVQFGTTNDQPISAAFVP
ncbi:MAG: FG-GAP-like repeat-containing protein [Pyrinomonadaceae bacterium]